MFIALGGEMIEVQQSLENKALVEEKKKLTSYIIRLTGYSIFPYIDNIARITESNSSLLELFIGAVSIAYHAGRCGKKVDYDTISYFPSQLTKGEVNTFLEAIYKKGQNKTI